MFLEKSKDTVPYDNNSDDVILINLNKVCYIRLYKKEILYFYFGKEKPKAWKYINEQKALEALAEIKRLTAQDVYIDEEEN